MTTKPLAKSLHTVTVLVRYSQRLRAASLMRGIQPADWSVYVNEALEVFGYANAADPYGLAAAALKQLRK